VDKHAEVDRQSKIAPKVGTARDTGKPQKERVSMVVSESEMHADAPALEAGANVVNRIVVAMRFDSDDELGYPGIDLDGRGCPMFGPVGERGGRHDEGHRGPRVGCHAKHKSA
jgi:hypothetical protein